MFHLTTQNKSKERITLKESECTKQFHSSCMQSLSHMATIFEQIEGCKSIFTEPKHVRGSKIAAFKAAELQLTS